MKKLKAGKILEEIQGLLVSGQGFCDVPLTETQTSFNDLSSLSISNRDVHHKRHRYTNYYIENG